MPDALICYRFAYSTHDPSPFETGESARDYLAKRLPAIRQISGVDYWVLVNEWLDNEQPASTVQKFTDFYCDLIDACRAQGIKCTVGDFSAGTPGWPGDPAEGHYLPILDKLFKKAEQYGFPVGWHLYDLLDRFGQRMPRIVSVLRYRAYIKDYPNLLIIGTEGGNAAHDNRAEPGMFRPDSLDYMKTFADLIKDDKQLAGICWWEVTDPALHRNNAEARWDLDDWTPILPAFFDWSASYSG